MSLVPPDLSRTNVRFIIWDMPKVSDAHRAARREQILDAAIRCVGREGFHRTTMAHVIAESGLSSGAVYGYFKGKPDIIKAIAGRALGGFSELLHDIASGSAPVTVAGALRAMVHEVERLGAESDGAFPKVVMHAWSEAARDPEILEIVGENVDRVHAAWVEVLRARRGRRQPPGAREHDAMARVLIGLMPGFVLQGLLLGKVDARTYADGFESLTVPLVLNGMPVDQSLVGRVFPPTRPYAVTEENVREFVPRPAASTPAAPRPPTFPIVLAFDAMNAFLEAEQIDLFRIVHGEQKFAYERPVVPGDVLTATLTVAVAAPDRRQRHHRHHQRDHRRRPARWSARPPPRSSTGGRTHDASPTQTFTITRADLVRVRRGQRRPQPDPPGRGGRHAASGCPA